MKIDNGIYVLSLFDGISCGQQALDRIGIKVLKYFSSEVDKYAIQVTRCNFPNTTFIGSVTDVEIIDIGNGYVSINGHEPIDINKLILIGGSPCQGFSFVGKLKGASTKCNIEITSLEQYLELKASEFDFEGQSYLFWEYIRVLNTLRKISSNVPFLLENVKMSKKWKNVFDTAAGVSPVLINSELLSAQMRPRYYWTSLSNNIMQPSDKKIFISDILEKSVEDKYYLSEKAISYINRDDRINKKLTSINGEKSLCLMSQYDQSKNGTFLCVDSNGRIDGYKTGALTQRYYKGNENYGSNPFILDTESHKYRKFTPIECERLQTVRDDYTAQGKDENFKDVIISNTQRYKMLGNCWTVEVISYLFDNLINKDRYFDNIDKITNMVFFNKIA